MPPIKLLKVVTRKCLGDAIVHGDYLAEIISREIKAYRHLSYKNMDLDVPVDPVRDPWAGVQWVNKHKMFIGYDRYVFDGWAKCKELEVQLLPNGVMVVWHLENWVSVAEFLQHLEAPSTAEGQNLTGLAR